MTISQRLTDLRVRSNMTQQEIADLLDMNLKAYQHYERDRAEPNITMLKKLSHIYGISIDELIYGKPRIQKSSPLDAYYRLPLEKRKIVDFILKS